MEDTEVTVVRNEDDFIKPTEDEAELPHYQQMNASTRRRLQIMQEEREAKQREKEQEQRGTQMVLTTEAPEWVPRSPTLLKPTKALQIRMELNKKSVEEARRKVLNKSPSKMSFPTYVDHEELHGPDPSLGFYKPIIYYEQEKKEKRLASRSPEKKTGSTFSSVTNISSVKKKLSFDEDDEEEASETVKEDGDNQEEEEEENDHEEVAEDPSVNEIQDKLEDVHLDNDN